MKHYTAIIAILFIFIAGVTLEAQDSNETVRGLNVTFQVFSGRPNPTFMITDEALIKKIESVFTQLPKNESFKGETVSPSILGYTGIFVENFTDLAPDIVTFLVYNSNVELHKPTLTEDGTIKEILVDTTAGLQEMLIQEGLKQGVIDEEIVNMVRESK